VVVTRLVPRQGQSEDRSIRNVRSQQLGIALVFTTLFGIALDHSKTLTRPPVLGTFVPLLLASMWIPGIRFSRWETSKAVLYGALVYTVVGLVMTAVAVPHPDWRLLPAVVFDVLAAILWTRKIVGRRQQT
jgi:hypothetical protein